MSALTGGEHESFRRELTSELRATVGELTQRPDGDFCAELAEWLITAGHVQQPCERLARDRERADLRMQRDRVRHQLPVRENAHRASTSTRPAASMPPADCGRVEVV